MSKSVLLPANPLAETYFHSSVNFTVKSSCLSIAVILIREMLSDSRQRDQSIWISQIGFVEVCGASRS